MRAEWGEHYLMGVDAIDKEHRELFKISRRILTMLDEKGIWNSRRRTVMIREGVKYILSYWQQHTRTEEEYMRSIEYEDYIEHKRLHDEFAELQLAKYQQMLDKETISKEEVLEFTGGGIGWLLEHISMADMAIVGKGALIHSKSRVLDWETIEREVDQLFTSMFNVEIEPKIINPDYAGEDFGKAIFHQLNYVRDGKPKKMLVGTEKTMLMSIAEIIYSVEQDEIELLIVATLEMMGGSFWRTLGDRLGFSPVGLQFLESHVMLRSQVQKEYTDQNMLFSVLFETNIGKFFIASDLWPEVKRV